MVIRQCVILAGIAVGQVYALLKGAGHSSEKSHNSIETNIDQTGQIWFIIDINEQDNQVQVVFDNQVSSLHWIKVLTSCRAPEMVIRRPVRYWPAAGPWLPLFSQHYHGYTAAVTRPAFINQASAFHGSQVRIKRYRPDSPIIRYAIANAIRQVDTRVITWQQY